MFKAWPKIPRLKDEVYYITEKIDGTNAAIIIQNLTNLPEEKLESPLSTYSLDGITYCIWAQSRTRLITPEDDNFGFAKWVKENAEQLIKDLGEGYHYGEWWGNGIQRGYGLDHKRFSLFNLTKHSEICDNVPYLCKSFDECLIIDINLWKKELQLKGSYAVPGYMKPEGMVVYAEKAKAYWKVIIDK